MQFPIFIELHRSRLLLVLLLIAHAGAAACVGLVPGSALLRGGLLAAIACSLARALRAPRIVGLRLGDKGQCEGRLADGTSVELAVASDTTVFSQLIVLRLHVGGEKRVSTLPLFTDQMPAERFRQLCLWLRWRRQEA